MLSKIIYNTILILITGLAMPCRSEAGDITIPTYYPALSGNYDQLRLPPRSADLSGACAIGSMYVNSAKQLQYCRDNSGTGIWGSISDVWTQDGDNIYLTDSVNGSNIHVGIGTKTPEFKLSIQTDAGIIAQGILGSGTALPDGYQMSRLIWYPRKAAFRAGLASGAQWDDANIGNYSAAMGKDSKANGNFSVVGGGDGNTASYQYASVIGGQNNTASGPYAVIAGGAGNTANETYTTIVGGQSNTANNLSSAVGGGQNNQVSGLATASNIGGGATNTVLLPYSNINGGQNNTIDQHGALPAIQNTVIGGGANNQAHNKFVVISGGSNNSALAPSASVGGGKNNTASTTQLGVVVGEYSRVSGGESNITGGAYSTVSGGYQNHAWGNQSIIGGGSSNFIDENGANSGIAGGARNQINNGLGAMILGGSDNSADGNFSWANGKNMQLSAAADRTFAWGYSDTPVVITQPDAFIIAPGTLSASTLNPKVGIRDTTPTGALEINSNSSSDNYIDIKRSSSGDTFIVNSTGYIGVNKATPTDASYAMEFGNGAYLSGGGVWTNASSRQYKENIKLLTSDQAETTLDQLQPMSFKYKVSRKSTVGFIAEDVPDIVAMKDRRSLSSMDIIAVLTKTAQDQETEIKKQAEEIKEIQAVITKLKRESRK